MEGMIKNLLRAKLTQAKYFRLKPIRIHCSNKALYRIFLLPMSKYELYTISKLDSAHHGT